MFPTLFPWHPLTAESVVYGSGGGVVASLGELSALCICDALAWD